MSRVKKRKQRNEFKKQDEERQNIERKLKDRYGRKSENSLKASARLDRNSGRIHNPNTHIMQRCIQARLNRLNMPEEPDYLRSCKWLCAFCGLQSCANDLGDLFGPYYIKGAKLPEHLREDQRGSRDEFDYLPHGLQWYYDVWFHGDCAVWSENVLMFGGKFPNLKENLEVFWKERCHICHKVGASVVVDQTNRYVHYPCAKQKGYAFSELTMRCTQPSK